MSDPGYQAVPGGLIDNGSLSPLPGGGVGVTLPDIEGYLNRGGYSLNPNNTAPSVLPPSTPSPLFNNSTAAGQTLNQAAGTLSGALSGIFGVNPLGTAGAVSQGNAAGASQGSFFTQLGRLGTAVVGLVFIAGGLFLLAKGPAVNFVVKSGKDLALGA